MRERRYQVFVSSTFIDLQDERRLVREAILRLNMFPAGMELFPASNDSQFDLIKKVIDDSDYYVVIIGGRYGSADRDGLSYTQAEYGYALDKGIPILGFVRSHPEDLPYKMVDDDPAQRQRLEAFRRLVKSKMCVMYSAPYELAAHVVTSLIAAVDEFPAEGWVRGSHALTDETRTELLDLREQVQALRSQLDAETATSPADDLVQGEDQFTISYSVSSYREPSVDGTVTLSWDDIFRTLAPLMIDEGGESKLSRHLSGHIKPLLPPAHIKLLEKPDSYYSVQLRADDFQQIKVQFLALGLIEQSLRKRSLKDTDTYLALTARGHRALIQMRALRRPEHRLEV